MQIVPTGDNLREMTKLVFLEYKKKFTNSSSAELAQGVEKVKENNLVNTHCNNTTLKCKLLFFLFIVFLFIIDKCITKPHK